MMNNSSNRNSMYIVVTGIIIAVSRFLLGKINAIFLPNLYILIVMAVVNYVALGFVLLFLYNELCNRCKNKISSSGSNTAIKKKCNNVIFIISAVLLSIYLVLGIIYITFFKTNDLNDVISIMALAISIATNGLVDDYSDNYYKLILKISKYLINKKIVKEQES